MLTFQRQIYQTVQLNRKLWDQVTLIDFLLQICTYKVSKYPVIYDQCFFGEEQKIGPNYLQFFCRIPKIRELPGVWRYFRGFWQTGSHFSNNVAWSFTVGGGRRRKDYGLEVLAKIPGLYEVSTLRNLNFCCCTVCFLCLGGGLGGGWMGRRGCQRRRTMGLRSSRKPQVSIKSQSWEMPLLLLLLLLLPLGIMGGSIWRSLWKPQVSIESQSWDTELST